MSDDEIALRTALRVLAKAISDNVPDPHWTKIAATVRLARDVANARVPAEVYRFRARNDPEALRELEALR